MREEIERYLENHAVTADTEERARLPMDLVGHSGVVRQEGRRQGQGLWRQG